MGVPVTSQDGKKIFAIAWQPQAEMVLPRQNGEFTRYLSGLSATSVSFSRDKQWVAYPDFASGDFWRSKIDETGKLQLNMIEFHF